MKYPLSFLIFVCLGSTAPIAHAESTLTLNRETKIPIVINGKPSGSVNAPSGAKVALIEDRGESVLVKKNGFEPVVLPKSSFSEFAGAPAQESVPTPAPTQPKATPMPTPKATPPPAAKATSAITPRTDGSIRDPDADRIELPEQPAEDEVATFPPSTAPILAPNSPAVPRRKVLVVPSSPADRGYRIMWQIAKQLKEKGHDVRLLGRPQDMKPDDAQMAFAPEDWISRSDLRLAEIDAVLAQDRSPDLERTIYEAIDLGKIVIIGQKRGPWPFIPDKKEANKLEADYLRAQVEKGYLEQTNGNSGWANAPWAESDGKEINWIKAISVLRPGDVVCWKNVFCYAAGIDGGSNRLRGRPFTSQGYSWDYGKGWAAAVGYNAATTERLLAGVIIPVIQEAFRTYSPSAFKIEPDNLKMASYLPARPKLPRSFPLERPKEAGVVISWGDPKFSSETAAEEQRQKKGRIPESLRAVQVAVSYEGTSIALKPDGTVIAWGGKNENGECDVPEGLSGVVQVAVGGNTCAALKDDGTVVLWGEMKPDTIPANLSNVVQVAIHQDNCYFLKADGTVVKSGGDPDRDFDKRMKDLGRIVQISGGRYPIALTEDGKVAFLSPQEEADEGIYYVPKRMGKVASLPQCHNDQASHVAVLLIDGTVAAWGPNDTGQCNAPIGLSDVIQVSTSNDHSFVVKRDGKIVGWGSNDNGELDFPPAAKDIIQVAPGPDFCLAIARDSK